MVKERWYGLLFFYCVLLLYWVKFVVKKFILIFLGISVFFVKVWGIVVDILEVVVSSVRFFL